MSKVSEQFGYLRQAWLVILLGLAYGATLAGVQTTLGPRIADNKKKETYDKIPVLVKGADKDKTIEMELEDTQGKMQRVYKTLDGEGNHNGWVIPAAGQGFADRIELLIGLNADASTITGMYVLDQKETPGLGNYITEPYFQDRFREKPTDSLLVVVKADPKGDDQILALSGATISSESVCKIVNDTIAKIKGPISKQLKQPAGEPDGGA